MLHALRHRRCTAWTSTPPRARCWSSSGRPSGGWATRMCGGSLARARCALGGCRRLCFSGTAIPACAATNTRRRPCRSLSRAQHPRAAALFERELAPWLSQSAISFWRSRLRYFGDGLYFHGGMVSLPVSRLGGCALAASEIRVGSESSAVSSQPFTPCPHQLYPLFSGRARWCARCSARRRGWACPASWPRWRTRRRWRSSAPPGSACGSSACCAPCPPGCCRCLPTWRVRGLAALLAGS